MARDAARAAYFALLSPRLTSPTGPPIQTKSLMQDPSKEDPAPDIISPNTPGAWLMRPAICLDLSQLAHVHSTAAYAFLMSLGPVLLLEYVRPCVHADGRWVGSVLVQVSEWGESSPPAPCWLPHQHGC